MRASLPRNRIGVHLARITDVATSVDSSVSVQDLFVPTIARCSDPVAVSGNRCAERQNSVTSFFLVVSACL